MHKSLLAIGLCGVYVTAIAQTRPAVVELFTSQGCSSCPPAEKYLGELARRPAVLALTFHVDYWDELGWRDRFSLPQATGRQRDYAAALGLRSVYTPQAIVDGTREFVGSNRAAIDVALHEGRTDVPVGLSIHDASIVVDVGTMDSAESSDVLLIAYLRSATTAIGRGENAGRTIQESNIVRSVRTLGHWRGMSQQWQARLESLPGDATDVAVLVQRLPQGAIIGAAHMAVR